MSIEKKLCVICAWRESCKKKFSAGSGKINCPDFSKDASMNNLKEENYEDTDSKFAKKNSR
jgi:hypothetical protein